MPLIHADYCKVCGKHRTSNPNGVCSACKSVSNRVVCRVCGDRTTNDPDGICSRCTKSATTLLRRTKDDTELLKAALDPLTQNLYILEHRLDKEPMSFEEIGKALGLARSTVYARYKWLLSYGSRNIVLEHAKAARKASSERT